METIGCIFFGAGLLAVMYCGKKVLGMAKSDPAKFMQVAAMARRAMRR